MERFLQIVTVLILTYSYTLSQTARNQRSTEVYIDGKKVKLNNVSIIDTIDFKIDASLLYNSKLKSEGIIGSSLTNPIKVLDSIFTDYIKYEESTVSLENKKMFTKALNQLDSSLTVKDLILIINIWLYYDPTDFPTRTLTETVFKKNIEKSIAAIKNRKENKMAWETGNLAPYSELDYLIDKLGEEKNK